jgi:hypothetical protein
LLPNIGAEMVLNHFIGGKTSHAPNIEMEWLAVTTIVP